MPMPKDTSVAPIDTLGLPCLLSGLREQGRPRVSIGATLVSLGIGILLQAIVPGVGNEVLNTLITLLFFSPFMASFIFYITGKAKESYLASKGKEFSIKDARERLLRLGLSLRNIEIVDGKTIGNRAALYQFNAEDPLLVGKVL